MEELEYSDRLRELSLPSLQHRRRRGDMIQVYKIVSGMDRIDADSLFPPAPGLATRSNGEKIFKQRSRLDIRKNSFTMRVVDDWNRLPASIVGSETLDQFKARLDRHWIGERFENPFS